MTDHLILHDLVRRAPITVKPGDAIEVALGLMEAHRISAVIVTAGRRPVGIFTERDAVRLLLGHADRDRLPVEALMTPRPVTAPGSMAFLEGYYRMTEHRIRHLILVDEAGDLAGIVTETDFMRHLKLDAFLEPQRVEALMTPQPITLGPQATVAEALTLMHQHRISSIVVTGAGCPIGILSERDAVRLARQGLALNQIPLGGVMSRPVRIVSTETLAHEANVRMKEERIRHLAVVDSAGQLAGILTEHDMVKGLQGRYTEFLRRVIEHQGRELNEARQVLSETLVLEHILRGALDVALVAADRDRRVHYINPAAAALFGVERGAARGQSLEALHHLAGLDEAQLATGLAAADAGASHEYRCGGPSTAMLHTYQGRIAPIIDEGGQHLGYVQTLHDITAELRHQQARERLERELFQARKMEAIGQLAGGIAHDFNNILATVLGYTQLALDLYGDAGGKLRDYLEQVQAAGRRARALVRSMLTFSRGSDAPPQPLQPLPLIKEIVKMLRPTLPSTYRLELHGESGLPEVLIDPIRLQQMVLNLVLNARDALDVHGRIEVRLYRDPAISGDSAVTGRPLQGDWLVLAVADNGHGMTPEVLEHAFEPFFTTKAIGQGSGMGLAVVQGIVATAAGDILVDTAPGLGTTVRVLLPVAPVTRMPVAGPLHPVTAAAKMLTGYHLLVVDDDPGVAGYLGELLAVRGARVTPLLDPLEALALFERNPCAFEGAVCDLTMPGMTGIELAERLQACRPGLPVILVTGYGEPMPGGLPATAMLLTKPIDVEALVAALASALRPAGMSHG